MKDFDFKNFKLDDNTQKIINDNIQNIMNVKPQHSEIFKPIEDVHKETIKIIDRSNNNKSRNELVTRIATILAAIFGFFSIILSIAQIYLVYHPPTPAPAPAPYNSTVNNSVYK